MQHYCMVEFTAKKHDWGQEASKSQKKMTHLTEMLPYLSLS